MATTRYCKIQLHANRVAEFALLANWTGEKFHIDMMHEALASLDEARAELNAADNPAPLGAIEVM